MYFHFFICANNRPVVLSVECRVCLRPEPLQRVCVRVLLLDGGGGGGDVHFAGGRHLGDLVKGLPSSHGVTQGDAALGDAQVAAKN